MVISLHIRLEMTDTQPTQQRHHRLEESKEKGHAHDTEGRFFCYTRRCNKRTVPLCHQDNSANDGNRKAIHRQGYG